MNYLRYDIVLRRITAILSIVILTLGIIASISGILIAFYYEPTAGNAYQSLTKVNSSMPYGWLVYSLHNLAGNGIIIIALIQLVVMFLGRQFRRSWLAAWISGILLTLATIGLGWTAMILNWNQLGYWRLKVELGTIASIPLIGATLRNILTGGGGINTSTVVHFYAIHSYVLSIVAIALAVVHLVALIIQEREQKNILLQQLEKSLAPTSSQSPSPEVENVGS
jgi:cytochrome b6